VAKTLPVVVLLGIFNLPLLTFTLARSEGGQQPSLALRANFFRMQELDTGLKIGYAVLLVDLDGDGKRDIVVVDKHRVVWFQNPDWKKRTILDGQTAADNVCIAAADIDGDGQLDLALGAGWAPSNTQTGGTLQWLRRGKTLDEPWTLHPIASEPTLHRIRFADLDGTGKPSLLVAPLHGRGATGKNNWTDGAPVRLLAYDIPKDPVRDRWPPRVLNESLHVMHNFWPVPAQSGKGMDVLTASYEGVHLVHRIGPEKWGIRQLGEGDQSNPKSSRGSSEVKQGKLKGGRKFIATIEPWHGNQVVVYTEPADGGKLWDRHVLDDHLAWGHAVWCADLDGDGGDELIIGVRDDPGKNATFQERRGVRVYKAQDDKGERWARQLVDPGGVAVEDLAVADLDGDGRPDIVAVGRQTHNVRIYWNQK
jgi:hypothetical protein